MKRPRKTAPGMDRLEARQLLSLAATWLGQDGHDLAGPSAAAGPSGVQDVHLSLTGLPADRSVVSAEVRGLGGGTWLYRGGGGWAAAFVRSDATRGELFFEPYQIETGRPFDVVLYYDDGSTDAASLAGGPADPSLRTPADTLRAAWIGQDGHDSVGRGPAVGPDGIQDVHLSLSGLTPTVPITTVRVEGPPGIAWTSGPNPGGTWIAQLDRRSDDPSQADLWLNPDRDLAGQDLSVTVVYATGATDAVVVTAGPTDPKRAVAPPAPPPARVAGVQASWLGQDGLNLTGPGDVHVSLTGLPAGRTVVAAVLTDEAGLSWAYQAPGAPAPFTDPFPGALGVRVTGSRAEITFPPRRDESGSALTLRLNLDDGTIAVVPIAGGAADLSLRAARPDSTRVTARPGDDLNDLANRYGTVQLTAGTYALSRPLVLTRPVTITADPGATLLFTQPASASPWTAAIKVHAANTTLDGFAVRFGGPVRWDWDVPYGPAVIGTTDNRDQRDNALKVNLVFTRLDLQGPPVSPSAELTPAPGLLRLVTADSGRIERNTLRGGSIEVVGGPWSITNNEYRGAVAGTSVLAIVAGHQTHDLVVAANHAEPQAGAGKTWRFLVLTQSGFRDRVEDNTVIGIGPRDDDSVPSPNATEIVLTEAYRLKFEGRPLAVSTDGRVLQIPEPQGGPAQAGDVVAILDGPAAGQWRRVTQALDARTYLLDSPLPAGTGAISIGAGLVGETFRGNTIDARGSTLAADMVLAGAHYGTQVVGNRLLGGRYALLARSGPSESPVAWGWSHTPQLGLVVRDNTMVDSAQGSVLGVEHAPAIQTNRGRVYFAATVTNNTFGSTPAFLVAHPAPTVLTVGEVGSLDPAELRLALGGSVARGSAATILVHAGLVNGLVSLESRSTLRLTTLPAPATPALVRDTGPSALDGLTADGRIRFTAVTGAVGYEYRVGASAEYQPVAASGAFLPVGLAEGSNTVAIRALDEYGVRGPGVSVGFVLDTVAPPAVSGLGLAGSGTTVRFNATGPSDTYEYRVGLAGVFQPLGLATAFVPAGLAIGSNTVAIRATDRAGNVGPLATLSLIVAPPPTVLSGQWIGQDGVDRVGPGRVAAPDGLQDVHISLIGLRPDLELSSVTVSGLGGGVWAWNGPAGVWAAAVRRGTGATTADLFLQPYQRETGRPFRIDLRYRDGTTAGAWLIGGPANPALRMTTAATAPGTPQPAGVMTRLPRATQRMTTPRWHRLALHRSLGQRRGR